MVCRFTQKERIKVCMSHALNYVCDFSNFIRIRLSFCFRFFPPSLYQSAQQKNVLQGGGMSKIFQQLDALPHPVLCCIQF